MKSLMSRALIALLAFVALIVPLAACSGADESDPHTLTVGFVVDPSWAQVPVAQQAGYFDRHGVKVKVVNFSTGVEALQALAAGQLDIATAADVPAAAALTRSPALRIVGDGSRWEGSRIVARRSAGIASLADLGGRSVGTPLGTSAAYFASNALSHNNIGAKLVQVAPQAMVTAAGQRNVDAVAIFQPYQAQVIDALGGDAVELAGGTYSQHSLYLATDNAVTRKPDALTAFFAALGEAGTELTSGAEPAITAVAASTQLSADLIRKILPEFDFRLQLRPELAGTLTTLADWAKSQGSLDKAAQLPDYQARAESKFVPQGG
ncbi:ABC transporter substrate-binding protein [Nocardia aobensis]|uniref:ABC transporter substrate-binding protein n=1 Tax=Nocardia aobensis TaxID=257277 RepID=UPI0002FE089E|nr:ABC transporter substrate-binding protein [Nocardia aobensis]